MKWPLLILLLTMVACGKKEDKVSASSIEEEFASAAKSRNISFSRTTESINIVSKSTMDSITSSNNANIAGFCLCPTTGSICKIYLRQDIWDSSSDKTRREMLFHELGHCNLRKEHNSNAINIGNGASSSCIFHASIMYPQLSSTSCNYSNLTPIDFVSNHWGDFLDELFLSNQSILQRYGSVYTPSSSGGRSAILFNKLTQKPTETDPPLEKDQISDDFLNHIYAYKVKKVDECTYLYDDVNEVL
jgi:hypothetical protein